MGKDTVTVISRRFDGSVGKQWKCELVERKGSLIGLLGVFDREITHEHLGTILSGTISYEYYWLDKFYNVFKFCEPDGTFRNYYCNINLPPTFAAHVLDYVDLDLDLLVDSKRNIVELDREDYERNAVLHSFDNGLRQNVEGAVAELRTLIEAARFPFDQTFP